MQLGDDNSRHPKVVTRDPEALHGRGIEIVRLLATSRGVRDDTYGKTICSSSAPVETAG